MKNIFQKRRSRLNRVNDRHWAELIEHFPLKQAVGDELREKFIFHAILKTAGEKQVELADRGIDLGGVISSGKAELLISLNVSAMPEIKQGDKIRSLDRWNQPWFLVENIDDRRRDRLLIHLSESK